MSNQVLVSNEVVERLKEFPVLLDKLLRLEEKQNIVKELRKSNGELDKPIVVTITGTPRAGKTTCINNLYDFLKKTGFRTECLEEPAGLVYKTLKNSEEKAELLSNRVGFVDRQFEIATEDIKKHQESNEILLCDRGVMDTAIWYEMYYQQGLIGEEKLSMIRQKYHCDHDYYNWLYLLSATPSAAIERDVLNSLSLAPRTTMNIMGVTNYNQAMDNLNFQFQQASDIYRAIDTSNLDRMDASIIAVNDILDNVSSLYLRR